MVELDKGIDIGFTVNVSNEERLACIHGVLPRDTLN
jgi:hypothetical protein